MLEKRNVTILEEKIEGEEKIVRMLIDGTSITVRRLYDTCNRVFKDYPECFYTPEQTKEKNRLLAMQNKEL